jgi:COMPASS component SWD3
VHEDNAPVTSVRFSPNGKYVLAATLDSSLRLWNYVEGRCVKTYQGHKNQKYSIGVCFGTYSAGEARGEELQKQWALAACGSEDGSTVLWDVNSKEVLQRLQGHEGVVLGVDVCAQDGAVATCGIDKTIKIYRRRQAGPAVNGQAHTGAEDLKAEGVEFGGAAQTEAPVEGTGAVQEAQSSQPTPPDTVMQEG